MKAEIHPEYREVCFQDVAADWKLITKSTVKTKDMIEVDGKEYPLVSLSITSASHPYYTGKQKFVDTAGRIEKFQRRYQISDGKGTDTVMRAKKGKKATAVETTEAADAEA